MISFGSFVTQAKIFLISLNQSFGLFSTLTDFCFEGENIKKKKYF